jgi:Fe-S-cluster containining protein
MPRDAGLVQIVDAAMAEAVRKSGAWIACKPGCTPCCMGTFPITQLDAGRLQEGLRALDPDRATHVRDRAREAAALPEDQADDWPCPALDPVTGLCELYEARPLTCRTFGPAVRWGSDAVGACELCYDGATDEEIAACAVEIHVPDELESTTVALALLTAAPKD